MKSKINIDLNIAEIHYSINSFLSQSQLGLCERFGSFFGKPSLPLYSVNISWNHEIQSLEFGKLIYDPGSIWKLYVKDQIFTASFFYNLPIEPNDRVNVIQTDNCWKSIRMIETVEVEEWKSLLNFGAGELILRSSVLYTNALLVHSAGICINDKCVLIAGHSGEGKSTLANILALVPNSFIINEDRMLLRAIQNGVHCYGTPWSGSSKIALNFSKSLTGIILLKHASENHIERISHVRAFTNLLSRSFMPFWDPSLMVKANDVLSAIVKSVPVYELSFKPDESVIPYVVSII